MKIGLFFGTFNPLHIGHKTIASYIADYTDIDRVIFVISPMSPFKQKEEILETIKQIGSDNFKIRESATQKLWKFGKSAEPLLRDALKNGGPELRYRGTKILEEFELGLYPDTPEDIAKLINDYRSGVGVKKEAAIIKMAELGKTELLMKLIKRENDLSLIHI